MFAPSYVLFLSASTHLSLVCVVTLSMYSHRVVRFIVESSSLNWSLQFLYLVTFVYFHVWYLFLDVSRTCLVFSSVHCLCYLGYLLINCARFHHCTWVWIIFFTPGGIPSITSVPVSPAPFLLSASSGYTIHSIYRLTTFRERS